MPIITGDNRNSKEERIAYHIDHALSLFHNITKKVAIIALKTVIEENGDSLSKKDESSLNEWQILGQVRVLKNQLQRNRSKSDPIARFIVQTLEEKVLKQLEQFVADDTSYDYMTNAMLQRFQFHPYKAKALFQKAISLNCRNFEAIYCQSMISLRLIRVIDYLKCLKVALFICDQEIHEMNLAARSSEDPDMVWFDESPINMANAFKHAILGRIYIKYKSHKRALREYKIALRFDPRFMFSYFYMGQYYAFDGERNEALAKKNFEKALSLVGVQRRSVYTSLIYDNMGQSCENFTDNQAAMECYERAIQCNEL
jgi:tetratricopeptide (TPR) repeat protein